MKLSCSIVVLLGLANYGLALQCYNCDTTQPRGEACDDPFESDRYVTSVCPRPEALNQRLSSIVPGWRGGVSTRTIGQHVCTKFIFTVGWQTVLMRSCFSLGNETCSELEAGVLNNNGVMHFCETCEEDGCNGEPITTTTRPSTTTRPTTTIQSTTTEKPTVKPVSSLDCYNCDTTQPNNKCKDPFDKKSNKLSPCPRPETNEQLSSLVPGLKIRAGNEHVCTKFEFSVDKNRTRILMRSCFSLGNKTCSELEAGVLNNNGVMLSCQTCQEDGCNLAPSLQAFSVLALLAAVLARVV